MSCPHTATYPEPLKEDGDVARGEPICVTFALVSVCAACKRPQGDVRMLTAKKPKEFGATSWRLMMDHHPFPPYHFKMSKDGKVLVPATLNEETSA